MIFNFSEDADLSSWYILDDGVMGGLSRGNLKIGSDGQGIYSGNISLDNYGGFSSLRYRSEPIPVTTKSKLVLRIKGDGKQYQIRIKDDVGNQYSYINYFETTTEWEEVVVDISNMYPSFRGRRLRIPNFNKDQIEEISILFGNKKEETFKIEIDHIRLED